jgi:hypothetical protein
VSAAIADELVAFQGSGDFVIRGFFPTVNAIGAENLPHATQIHRLGPFIIQGDDVLNGAAQVGFPLGCEQHSAGADVLCAPDERNPFGAGARD